MNTRWSLRQLFLWVFIAALIIPYLLALAPRRIDPLLDFSISDDVRTWLREVDPTVQFVESGGSSMSGLDSVEADQDFVFLMDNANPNELFAHLVKRVEEKIDEGKWEINEKGRGNDSVSFVVSNGFSRCRLYIYLLPLESEQLDPNRKRNKLRIKMIKIGYMVRGER